MPRELCASLIDVEKPTLPIHLDHADLCILVRGPQPALARAQSRFALLQFGCGIRKHIADFIDLPHVC